MNPIPQLAAPDSPGRHSTGDAGSGCAGPVCHCRQREVAVTTLLASGSLASVIAVALVLWGLCA